MSEEEEKKLHAVRHAFKVALSMVLFYWFILSQDWALTLYGAYAIIFCSLDTSGATIEKGLMRLVGTTVGIGVSFVVIAAFGQDRWLLMMSYAIYLVGIGYGMQGSNYSYGWYVGGFLPLVVWGNTYPDYSGIWSFAAYRWLETVVGILIYTTVEVIFWPQTSGSKLKRSGAKLWSNIVDLFDSHCEWLDKNSGQVRSHEADSEQESARRRDELQVELTSIRAEIAKNRKTAIDDLQRSLLDTPAVQNYRAQWNALRDNVNQLVRHIELWGESTLDCRHVSLSERIPNLHAVLESTHDQLQQIQSIWDDTLDDQGRRILASPASERPRSSELVAPTLIELDGLSQSQRAAIANFVYQLRALQHDIERTMTNLRVITGMLPPSELANAISDPERLAVYQPRQWSPDRFILSLFPALTWVIGFFFWVELYPPTNTSQVHMGATMSLMVLRERINPIQFTIAILVLLVIVALPIVWVVMPKLSTPEELLTLVFIYTFISCYLGSKVSVLKVVPLVLFATLSSISNQQEYSFEKSVDAGLMFALCGPIMSLCWFALVPMRAEQELTQALQRFYMGCSRVLDGFFGHSNLTRKRHLETLVLPAADQIRKLRDKIELVDSDQSNDDDEPSEEVESLLDAVDGLANRLIGLQEAYRQATAITTIPPEITALGHSINDEAQQVFNAWSELRPATDQASMRELIRQLEVAIDTVPLSSSGEVSAPDLQVVDALQPRAALHVLLGSLRGLADAIARVDRIMARVDWQYVTAPRF